MFGAEEEEDNGFLSMTQFDDLDSLPTSSIISQATMQMMTNPFEKARLQLKQQSSKKIIPVTSSRPSQILNYLFLGAEEHLSNRSSVEFLIENQIWGIVAVADDLGSD